MVVGGVVVVVVGVVVVGVLGVVVLVVVVVVVVVVLVVVWPWCFPWPKGLMVLGESLVPLAPVTRPAPTKPMAKTTTDAAAVKRARFMSAPIRRREAAQARNVFRAFDVPHATYKLI